MFLINKDSALAIKIQIFLYNPFFQKPVSTPLLLRINSEFFINTVLVSVRLY